MTAAPDFASAPAGFADPARQAQRVFRAVMQATARPGSVADLSHAPAPPAGLPRAAAALALTLCDRETPVWLAPALRTPEIEGWLRFHCGSPQAEPDGALFAFAPADAAPDLSDLDPGDPRYPDRSTTLVLLCEALSGGPERRLSGPGIDGERVIAPVGPPPSLWRERAAMHARFPLGVDLVLAAGDSLICVPRTARNAPEPA